MSEAGQFVYLLGDREFDPANSCLRTPEGAVPLRLKALQVLLYLVHHSDRIVGKQELHDEVWPDVVVSDDALVQTIVEIRRALGDNARAPRLLETIPGQGYRFIGPVEIIRDASDRKTQILRSIELSIEETIEETPDAGRRPLVNAFPYGVLGVGCLLILMTLFSWWGLPREKAPDSSGSENPFLVEGTENPKARRHFLEGLQQVRSFQIQQGLALLEQAVQEDPDFAFAQARIGHAYTVNASRPDLGLPFLERAASRPDRLNDLQRRYLQAWTNIARQDYPSAEFSLKELIKAYPTEVEAHETLGRLLEGENRLSEAAAVLEQALRLEPSDVRVYNNLGNVRRSLYQMREAIHAHRRYVELSPDEANAYDSLGLSLQAAGRYEEARQAYEKALQLDPRFEYALYHLASLAAWQGRFQDAFSYLHDYSRVAATDREVGFSHFAAAALLADSGKISEAWERVQSGEKVFDSTEVSLGIRLRILLVDNQLDQARELVPQFLAYKDPYNGLGQRNWLRFDYHVLGLFYLESEQYEEALSSFRRAQRARPPFFDPDPMEDGLARALLKLDRIPAAIAEWKRILSFNPRYPRAHFYLARCYRKQNEFGLARDHLLQFLDEWHKADVGLPELTQAQRWLQP